MRLRRGVVRQKRHGWFVGADLFFQGGRVAVVGAAPPHGLAGVGPAGGSGGSGADSKGAGGVGAGTNVDWDGAGALEGLVHPGAPEGTVNRGRGGQSGPDPLVLAIGPPQVQTSGSEFATAVRRAETL